MVSQFPAPRVKTGPQSLTTCPITGTCKPYSRPSNPSLLAMEYQQLALGPDMSLKWDCMLLVRYQLQEYVYYSIGSAVSIPHLPTRPVTRLLLSCSIKIQYYRLDSSGIGTYTLQFNQLGVADRKWKRQHFELSHNIDFFAHPLLQVKQLLILTACTHSPDYCFPITIYV